MVATDPANLSDEKRSILMNPEVLAVHADSLYISGERIYNKTDGSQLWSRPLSNGDLAVIAFNSGSFDAVSSMTFNWDELGHGWSNDYEVNVRCLWGQKDLGTYTSSFTTPSIPVHDHFFYRLSRV